MCAPREMGKGINTTEAVAPCESRTRRRVCAAVGRLGLRCRIWRDIGRRCRRARRHAVAAGGGIAGRVADRLASRKGSGCRVPCDFQGCGFRAASRKTQELNHVYFQHLRKTGRRALAFPITPRDKNLSQVFISLYDGNRGRRPDPPSSSAAPARSCNSGSWNNWDALKRAPTRRLPRKT